ncbi:lipopolysaccharide biosynthesis protein [Bacillus marasmi]|uniref:lipopolysaccharide biosynthesis protein n=1 Tax=Bacillus marasmi TaxID=1926279 RepID=UPI0011C8D6F2|nr:oligosaccharide flippase family protein [Bacillus marasmi]
MRRILRLEKLKNLNSDTITFIKHSKNYITAEFFIAGLTFLSIPLLTRLLSPGDYGLISLFSTLVSIMIVLFSLNIHSSIRRAYFDFDEDFNKLLGSNIIFLILFNFIILCLIYTIKENLSALLNIDQDLIMYAAVISSASVLYEVLIAYLQAIKKSGKYAILSVFRSSSILILTLILIVVLSGDNYLGRIYSEFLIKALLFFYSLIYISKIASFSLKWKYIKYTLIFGLPLIPHSLSGYILTTFDRIIINQVSGSIDTGLYSFAYNVGMIMSVFVMALNKSWVPIFFDKLKKQESTPINILAGKYSLFIYLASIVLIMFSKETVLVLADERYFEALKLVPVIILSYVFVFLYTLYSNYAFYRKKTMIISLSTLLTAIINITLNYLLVPIYGYVIAAYTTLFSYVLLFILHYLNAKILLKEKNIIELKLVLPNITLVIISAIFVFYIDGLLESFFYVFFIKVIYICICALLLFKPYIKDWHYKKE